MRPRHSDIWQSLEGRRFSVMHVCGHHDPPHVTGYWWTDGSLDVDAHDSIPLPTFLTSMTIVSREFAGRPEEPK